MLLICNHFIGSVIGRERKLIASWVFLMCFLAVCFMNWGTETMITAVCVDTGMVVVECLENCADDAVLWIGGFVL